MLPTKDLVEDVCSRFDPIRSKKKPHQSYADFFGFSSS